MMNKSKVQSYLHAIRLGDCTIDCCDEIMEFLQGMITEEIVAERETIAALFYETLAVYQEQLGNEAALEKGDCVKRVFPILSQIGTDGDLDIDANLATIAFLNELYQKRNNKSLDQELFESHLKHLIQDLGTIRFVFKIEDESVKMFPVYRLMADVIGDPEFIKDRIKAYHVYMLQMAVELFEAVDENSIVDRLVAECNLKFINYMNGGHKVIDTVDMLNYRRNGVMIFYNAGLRSVLIRHEKREYFNKNALDIKDDFELREEKNYDGETIGYFVELPVKGELIDFSEAISELPVEFLRLLFDKDCKNVFLENSIIREADNSLRPINPFCTGENSLIKGKLRQKNGKEWRKTELHTLLLDYCMQCISGNGINRSTVGLCVSLLSCENTGADSLGLDCISDDMWNQNLILKNWVMASTDKKEALEFVLEKWLNELAYCKGRLDHYEICKNNRKDLYPIPFDLQWVYDVLNLPAVPSIYVGNLIKNEAGDVEIEISAKKTKAALNQKRKTGCIISGDEVDFTGEIDRDDFYEENDQIYLCLRENGVWCSDSELMKLYKLISEIEMWPAKYLIDDSLRLLVSDQYFSDIKKLMELNKIALMDVGDHEVFRDFESMVVYRLIHNLIRSSITAKSWETYYKILNMHQVLSFAEIDKDKFFKMENEGALYVPKDNIRQDAVMYGIYNNYIKSYSSRDKHSFYDPIVCLDLNGKYCVGNQEIKKVVFLFDTIESGSASTRTVASYLGKPDEWKNYMRKRKPDISDRYLDNRIKETIQSLQVYYDDTHAEIKISDIIECNKPQIYVHSYYGTDQGDSAIISFLSYCGLEKEAVHVSHMYEIASQCETIREDCKMIWPDQSKNLQRDFYTVVREFNMTKRNVFPEWMCGDVSKATCMFVKKTEFPGC